MPKPYEVINNYITAPLACKWHLAKAEFGLSAQQLRGLPGREIMALNPTGFADLFQKMVHYIHNGGRGYAWLGSSGGAGYRMLDGDTLQGQCRMYADALAILAWAPPPYGLGLPRNHIEVVPYDGPTKKGFVSLHPNTGVMGLAPNVKNQSFYFWENHKVVRYQGRYYDVMYNNIYNALSDMVAYGVYGDGVEDGGDIYHPCDAPKASDGKGVWFKEKGVNQYRGPSTSIPF